MMREKHPGSIYLTSSRCGAELFPLTRDIAVRNQQHTRPYSSAFLFTSQKSTVWTEIPPWASLHQRGANYQRSNYCFVW
jgi:hypothetical protein